MVVFGLPSPKEFDTGIDTAVDTNGPILEEIDEDGDGFHYGRVHPMYQEIDCDD